MTTDIIRRADRANSNRLTFGSTIDVDNQAYMVTPPQDRIEMD